MQTFCLILYSNIWRLRRSCIHLVCLGSSFFLSMHGCVVVMTNIYEISNVNNYCKHFFFILYSNIFIQLWSASFRTNQHVLYKKKYFAIVFIETTLVITSTYKNSSLRGIAIGIGLLCMQLPAAESTSNRSTWVPKFSILSLKFSILNLVHCTDVYMIGMYTYDRTWYWYCLLRVINLVGAGASHLASCDCQSY